MNSRVDLFKNVDWYTLIKPSSAYKSNAVSHRSIYEGWYEALFLKVHLTLIKMYTVMLNVSNGRHCLCVETGSKKSLSTFCSFFYDPKTMVKYNLLIKKTNNSNH
jgi:hypothetical protein